MQEKTRVISHEQLAEQCAFSDKIKHIYAQRQQKQPLAMTMTFGCQQNSADTELIRGMLVDMGFGFTEQPMDADIVIINTCAIREHAETRVFGRVGALSHAKRANPNMVVALCGCMAQQGKIVDKIKKSYPFVDMVFGTHALYRFPQLLHQCISRKTKVFDISGDESGVIIEGVEPVREKGVCAWLSIMYGCNNFCSYCIVPYVRGRERSRRPEVILAEFKKLVDQGYKDITLLGQNVNSYGSDLEDGIDFPMLLKMVNDIDGDFQIRFMTSHPKDASKRLFDTMASCEKVCKSLHLPVQSGSNGVLERMNRRYTREHYLELVDYARSVMPEIAFTSDIIVGFPGETDEDVDQTIDLIEKVRFESLFTFLYSKREGTVAANMPDTDTKENKQRRFDKLLNAQNAISREINDSMIGKTVTVLVESRSNEEHCNLFTRTEGFKLVLLHGDESLIGQKVQAKITKCSTWALYAE